MFATIVGFTILLLSLWRLIYIVIWTSKNRRNMCNMLLFVSHQEKYEVINKEKFNYLMLLHDCILVIAGICIGIIATLTKDVRIFGPIALIISCMNLAFMSKKNRRAKKI